MIRFLKKIKKIKKISIFLPKKKNFLILDKPGASLIVKLLKKNSYEILDLRSELNVTVLLLSLLDFKKKKLGQKYIDQYIKIVKPKIVVSFIDNNIYFFEIEKNNKFKKIIIQNGTGLTRIAGKILQNKKKYNIDYFFVFSKSYSNFYSKFITGKTYIHGSLKNNFIPINNSKDLDHDILFISQFRDKKTFFHEKYSWDEYYKAEKQLISLLNKYCFEHNKKLTIAGFYKKNIFNENKFYEDIISDEKNKCKFSFLPRSNEEQTYKLIDTSNLIINIDSAIGYEALARENKLLFFQLRSHFLDDPLLKFGWPKIYPDEGEFWFNNFNIPIMNKKIDFMLNLSKNDWKKIKNQYIPDLMYYDKNNSNLKTFLNNHHNVQ